MKIGPRKTSRKKKTYLVIFILLVLIGFGAVFALYTQRINNQTTTTTPTSQSKIDYNPPTQEQINSVNTKGSGTSSDNTSKQNNQDQTNTDNTNLTITSAIQNGSILHITTLIQSVSSTGTCTMTMSQSGSSDITQTVDTQALASSSTCKGFNVTTSGMSGQWTLNIVYKDGTTTAKANKVINL